MKFHLMKLVSVLMFMIILIPDVSAAKTSINEVYSQDDFLNQYIVQDPIAKKLITDRYVNYLHTRFGNIVTFDTGLSPTDWMQAVDYASNGDYAKLELFAKEAAGKRFIEAIFPIGGTILTQTYDISKMVSDEIQAWGKQKDVQDFIQNFLEMNKGIFEETDYHKLTIDYTQKLFDKEWNDSREKFGWSQWTRSRKEYLDMQLKPQCKIAILNLITKHRKHLRKLESLRKEARKEKIKFYRFAKVSYKELANIAKILYYAGVVKSRNINTCASEIKKYLHLKPKERKKLIREARRNYTRLMGEKNIKSVEDIAESLEVFIETGSKGNEINRLLDFPNIQYTKFYKNYTDISNKFLSGGMTYNVFKNFWNRNAAALKRIEGTIYRSVDAAKTQIKINGLEYTKIEDDVLRKEAVLKEAYYNNNVKLEKYRKKLEQKIKDTVKKIHFPYTQKKEMLFYKKKSSSISNDTLHLLQMPYYNKVSNLPLPMNDPIQYTYDIEKTYKDTMSKANNTMKENQKILQQKIINLDQKVFKQSKQTKLYENWIFNNQNMVDYLSNELRITFTDPIHKQVKIINMAITAEEQKDTIIADYEDKKKLLSDIRDQYSYASFIFPDVRARMQNAILITKKSSKILQKYINLDLKIASEMPDNFITGLSSDLAQGDKTTVKNKMSNLSALSENYILSNTTRILDTMDLIRSDLGNNSYAKVLDKRYLNKHDPDKIFGNDPLKHYGPLFNVYRSNTVSSISSHMIYLKDMQKHFRKMLELVNTISSQDIQDIRELHKKAISLQKYANTAIFQKWENNSIDTAVKKTQNLEKINTLINWVNSVNKEIDIGIKNAEHLKKYIIQHELVDRQKILNLIEKARDYRSSSPQKALDYLDLACKHIQFVKTYMPYWLTNHDDIVHSCEGLKETIEQEMLFFGYDFKLNGTPVKTLQKKWKERNSIKIVSKSSVLSISNGKMNEVLSKNILATELKICTVPAAGAKKIENDQYRNCMASKPYKIVAKSGSFVEKYRMHPYQTIDIDIRIKVQTKNGIAYYKPYHDGILVQWWNENQKKTPSAAHTQEGQTTLEIFSGEGSFQDGYDFEKQAVQRITENGISNASLKPDIFYTEKEFIASPNTYKRLKVIDYGKKAINKIIDRPKPNDPRFVKIEYHKFPLLKGHTYALYTKRGKLVFINIIDMYQKPYKGYHINGIKFKWEAEASVTNSHTVKNKVNSIKKNQIQIHGKWIDTFGNKLSISQISNKISVTALGNKGHIGWEKAKGELNGNQVNINFNGQVLIGKIGTNNKNISWSNGVTWVFQGININKNKAAYKCPSSKNKAYKLYGYTYSQLKKLMNKGHGDTKEAQNLYKKYKFYKDCYTSNSNKQNKKTHTPTHTSTNKTNISISSASDISGNWKWFNGDTAYIYQNGTAESSNGNKGKWKAKWSGSGFTYIINWNNGQWIDTLTLHRDTLDGYNQGGTHVWGKRISKIISISSSIASILPGEWRWTCCSRRYTGIFKILTIDKNGYFSGKFGSTKADGDSPFNGYISGNKIKFTRTILMNGTKVGKQYWTAKVVFIQKQWHMSKGDWTGYGRTPGNGGFSAIKVSSLSQASGNSLNTGNTNLKPGVSSSKTQYGKINPSGEITITTFHTSPKGVNYIAYTSILVKDKNNKVYIQDPYKTNNNPVSKKGKPIPNNHFGVYPTEKTGYTVRDLIDAGRNGAIRSISTRYSKILPGSNTKVIGDKLKVTLHLKLNHLPVGMKYIYARTVDLGGVDSGWKEVGTFIISNTIKTEATSQLLQLPFYETFNQGTDQWTLPSKTSLRKGYVLWNTGNFNHVKLNKAIPMENIVIEFDGYAETNGINVWLQNDHKKGYTIILGGWYNTQSGSDIGSNTENRKLVKGNVWVPKRWQHYKIVRDENKLEAYCEGRLLFSRISNNRFKEYGHLKFDSWNALIGIDNIRIYRSKSFFALKNRPQRLLSGTYQVTQGMWKSTWKLSVINGQITGTSEWACCPGHRIDPIKGTISGNSVVIERDCSGQGWNGVCKQIFRGELKNNRIEGTCTGTGLHNANTWVLHLNASTSQLYRNRNRYDKEKYDRIKVVWYARGRENRDHIKFNLSNIFPSIVRKEIPKLHHFQTIGSNSIHLGIYQIMGSDEEDIDTYHSECSEKIVTQGKSSGVQQAAIDGILITSFNPPHTIGKPDRDQHYIPDNSLTGSEVKGEKTI